ncbi:MAG: response regulator [Cyanothece sp. SIO2G6]|nr:response regulator [Cyanothece sp. SIO2G6]
MRILLVDDDAALMQILAESLIRQRYAVDIAKDGTTAQEFLALFSYDILVLDMLLPDMDGVSLCRQCRQQGTITPILMLTAESSNRDKVKALDAGADDYVVKPFDFEELCARIRALLRRDSVQATTALQWGKLQVNPTTFEVTYGDHALHITPKEYALLELFLRHPDRVFSLDSIIESLWTYDNPPSSDAVRTHIKGLRQKLKAGGASKNFIETVYGIGYRLNPLETEAKGLETMDSTVNRPWRNTTPALVSPVPQALAALPSEQTSVSMAIANAWSTHRKTMHERLQVLQLTASALSQGQLSSQLRQDGYTQAHKLAGSLGCFGFPQGSQLARTLEQMLAVTTPFSDHQVAQFGQLVEQLRQVLSQNLEPEVIKLRNIESNDLKPKDIRPKNIAPRDIAPRDIRPRNIKLEDTAPSLNTSGNPEAIALHLLVMTTDSALHHSLLTNPSLHVTTAQHPREAQTLIQRHHATLDGVLLAITAANYDESLILLDTIVDIILDTTGQCQSKEMAIHHVAPLPVLILTDMTDMQQRLTLVQRGGNRLLPSSTPGSQVVTTMQRLLQEARSTCRIVLLDDDEPMLTYLQTLLAPQGWHLTPVSQPADLWPVLAAVQPHLLILDVEMPGMSGLDLCQILRADEQWRWLPIIFLTAHEETSIQHHAFEVGGDDFVNKANLTTELPRRILNRLKRSPLPKFYPVTPP